MLGTNTFGYWTRNADNLLIGKYLSSDSLGIYSQAYRILLFPVSNISGVINQVFFPSFSKIQDDKPKIKKYHLQLTRAVAFITFPLMVGLYSTSSHFVLALFGAKWSGMIAIIQIFCVLGINQSIMALNGNLYLSQGRADLQFRVGIIFKLNIIIGIIVGLQWGIMGVAIGYAIASLINVYPNFYFAGGLVDLSFKELVINLTPVTIVSLSMGGIVLLIEYFIPADWNSLVHLLIEVPAGVLTYWLLVKLFEIRAYDEIIGIIKEKLPQNTKVQ
jgi:PST family polysaccharide transporter